MSKLRNIAAVALTAAALGLGALGASPASAHRFGGFGHGHFGGFHHFGRFGHFGREHFRFGWNHHHFCHWGHCGPRYGGGWGWGGGWGGYRHVVAIHEAPVSVCPAGFHLGYLGKHCWPNR